MDHDPVPLAPERPLVLSPSLAARVGLKEAVMLHVIRELSRPKAGVTTTAPRWITASQATLRQAMPWWSMWELRQVRNSLLRKKLLRMRRLSDASGTVTTTLIAVVDAPFPDTDN